jgi:hypothetical protein
MATLMKMILRGGSAADDSTDEWGSDHGRTE